MINDSYKHNFDQLIRAGRNGDLCLMECTDAITGKPVITVCIHTVDGDDMHNMQPIAKLFDGVVAISGGDKTCRHDFPPEKTMDEDDWEEWTCSKCGMRVRYEVWC